MLIETIRAPGLLSLPYPFAIFAYAMLEEHRAGKHFWYFVIAFTQLRTLIDFVLI